MSDKARVEVADRKNAFVVWAANVDNLNERLAKALDQLQEDGYPVDDIKFSASQFGLGALIISRGRQPRTAFTVSS